MRIDETIVETNFELSREYTARPLEKKGLNKYYLNLVNADVFRPCKKNFWHLLTGLFSSVK